MKAVAFIPARFGSTRLNGKPLADICGKPMVQWVYERAISARLLSGVTVATDDERIIRAVASFGGRAVMTRASHRSGTDRIAEAARATDADIIVNLQGDEPLIEPGMIDDAVRPLMDDGAIVMSTLKTRIKDEREYLDPNAVKVVTDKDGFAIYFSRSPIPYPRSGFDSIKDRAFKHIGLYVYRKDFLLAYPALKPTPLEEAEALEQLRAIENGFRIKVVETEFSPQSVDTPEDLERVRGIIMGRV